ncbi:MAG: GAF domain-containing sensor histidine kinase, partial [Anaerolineae bacterium]|nr:GAF domain-containing sensor histidine kinase [Anaerolineae bacterium]
VGRLGNALSHLAQSIENRYRETEKLGQITTHINAGLVLDEILDHVYDDFRELIPYNRIGFSQLEDDGKVVRARWAKTDQPSVALNRGHSAPLAGSSLQEIIRTGNPRIINDLEDYVRQKPESQSSRLMLSEGVRSSLTCPLVANGVPIGFMFFSSIHPNTYAQAHVELFQQIAGQLSIILEKGRLVSEIMSHQAEIARQNDELQRLNDLKNTFLGIAAHDLRNPLSNIQMAAEILVMDDLDLPDDARNQIVYDMQRQVDYMVNLLNDLLDVSHIESGKLQLKLAPVDVPGFLAETVERQAKIASAKGTIVTLEKVAEGRVLADAMRLRQVLDNFISNAIKYSPPQSIVQVRAALDGRRWRIEVEDQGPGISPTDRERLFQDFARLSAQPTGGEKSTGLGLSITRRIIQAHEGEIGVDTELGQGSTFWFTLPKA